MNVILDESGKLENLGDEKDSDNEELVAVQGEDTAKDDGQRTQ